MPSSLSTVNLFSLLSLILIQIQCQPNITYPSWMTSCVDNNSGWHVVNCSDPKTQSFVWISPSSQGANPIKSPLSISNCFISDCPYVYMDSLNLTISNVTWKVSIQSQENQIWRSNVVANNLTLDGLSFKFATGKLSISNSLIKNVINAYDAALYPWGGSVAMENITFFNNSGSWDIQFAYGDSFSWKGGYIYSEVPNSQGAHSIDFGSNMDVHIEGVTFESIGGYNAKTAISLMCAPYIGSLTLKSITTKGFAGLGLLNANNVLVDGVNMIFDQDIGYAGLVSFGGPGGNNGNWTFVLQNTVFRDMRFGSTALFVSFGSNLLLSNVTFDNITVSGLAQNSFISNQGSMTMQGCTIQNVTNLGYGGFISTSSLGAVTMFSNSTFIGGKFSGVGGAFLVGSSGGGSLIVSGNSKLSSNIADYGAAIAILDGGSLSLLDNAQIFGNTATKCGSAIYISGGSSSTISSNVTIQDNQGARGAFLCLASDFANTSNIILLSSNNIAGSVWLPSRDLAKNFSDTMISSGVSLSGSIYPVSVPVSLSVLNSTKSSPVSFSVGPYESLPPFSIQVLDYFKNPSVISVANGDRIPVLYLNSVKRNGSIQRNVLTGEVSKIGLSSIVKFDQVSVSAMDGEYEYEVLAYRGAVDFDNTSVVWPMVSINVIACNGSNERLLQLSAGDMACYQTCPISITSKNSFGSLGVILAITSFLSVFLWTLLRPAFQNAMTSTPVLTTIIGCGNTISFIALALNLIQSPYYCVSWVWLWNIGYFLSIVALITKPVVVSQFRLDKRITKHVHRLLRKENRKERDKKAAIVATAGSRTDPSSPTTAPLPKFSIETQPPLSPSGIAPPQNYPHSPHPASPNGSSISNEPKPLIVSASKQLPSMIALFVALFAGLIAWTVISPPTYVEMVSGECVVTNACTSSTSPIFETVNHILRLLAIGGAVLTVISLRNTKGIRTELKSISFVVYNWTVFEILQVAVSSILANSPASQFIVTGITVLIPNLICIGMIVIRPVIICSSTPVQELSERVQIQNSVYNSVTSSMRESSMGVSMAMSRT